MPAAAVNAPRRATSTASAAGQFAQTVILGREEESALLSSVRAWFQPCRNQMPIDPFLTAVGLSGGATRRSVDDSDSFKDCRSAYLLRSCLRQ